jgi:hypothetical protein
MNEERNLGCRACAWHTSAKQDDKEWHNCWKWGTAEFDSLDGYRYHMLDLTSKEGRERNANGRCPGFVIHTPPKKFKPSPDHAMRIKLAQALVHALSKEHERSGQ